MLRLVAALDGRQISCRACHATLQVSAEPWELSVVRYGRPDEDGECEPDSETVAEEEEEDGATQCTLPMQDCSGSEVTDRQAVPLPEAPSEPLVLPEEEPCPESETSVEKPERWVPAADEFESNRHAQPASSKNSMAGVFLLAAAVLLAIGGLVAGGRWLFSGAPVHPQARYLPEDCEWFSSLRWSELAQSGFVQAPRELPGLALVERCRTFLGNAGLSPETVERINAGRAADGSGTILVYYLTRPVRPEDVMGRSPFRGSGPAKYEQETVRGVHLYTCTSSAIAFPEERVIVNGDAQLVRKILRGRSRGFRDPLNQLVDTLDFSATCVMARPGEPKTLEGESLQKGLQKESRSQGVTDSFHYGPTVRLVRLMYFSDEQAIEDLRQSVQDSLREASQGRKTPEAVRQMLASAEVSNADGKIQIEFKLKASQLSPPVVQALARLF